MQAYRSIAFVALLSLAAQTQAVHAQSAKNDILGFHVGMALEDAKRLTKEYRCVTRSLENNSVICAIGETGQLRLTFSLQLKPDRILSVHYMFHTGEKLEAVARSIEQQYAIRLRDDWGALAPIYSKGAAHIGEGTILTISAVQGRNAYEISLTNNQLMQMEFNAATENDRQKYPMPKF